MDVSALRNAYPWEALMNDLEALNRKYERMAWGLLFVLWGITLLFDALPGSMGILGTGLILLSLNRVRSLKGIPARGHTSILGILALVWGGLELARAFWPLSFGLTDGAIFAILLMALGTILLGRELQRLRKPSIGYLL